MNNIGASAQTDQRLCHSLIGKYHFTIFQLSSVAEETDLSLALLEAQTTDFLATSPYALKFYSINLNR